MRVNRISTYRTDKKKESLKVKHNLENSDFKKDLQTSLKEELRKKLSHLLKDIETQGENLINRRTLEDLEKYKSLVKNFLNTVVKNIYLLKEKVEFGPKGKQNVLVLVENIDKSLEELIKLVLNKETNKLKILEKLGEIKGLLIDLYS
ncbi:MAG: YaaR family protein [Candidatus Omnitrophica bacterium]|nr:YaaR family protein [Candidatus Omnitrophota bacterium]MCM8826847.1 YaaR family protein [Candidatus Omnitrophota bacterium]